MIVPKHAVTKSPAAPSLAPFLTTPKPRSHRVDVTEAFDSRREPLENQDVWFYMFTMPGLSAKSYAQPETIHQQIRPRVQHQTSSSKPNRHKRAPFQTHLVCSFPPPRSQCPPFRGNYARETASPPSPLCSTPSNIPQRRGRDAENITFPTTLCEGYSKGRY